MTIYTEDTDGRFLTVAATGVRCRMWPVGGGASGAGRAELAAFRRLLWAPGTTIDDHAQIEVESVRYNVVAGSIAPRRGPSGALDHYECDLMRATSG